MRIAIVTFTGMPADFTDDDERLGARLRDAGAEAEIVAWDRPGVDWDGYDLVVIRSTWDYSRRRDEFLAWAERIGERLHNSPSVVRWNSDKRYLADLAGAGLPVVETQYIAPGDALPPVDREVVVKPTISAGANSTGRFAPDHADDALALIGEIHAAGKTAMVQPFNPAVEERGETAVVLFDGELSHVLRKRAILRRGEVAPVRDDSIGAAEIMYDPGLVTKGEASAAEVEAAHAIVAWVGQRFDSLPLIARVDMLAAEDGSPVLLELEAIEPNLYFPQASGADTRLARAIVARARA